ncbi:MAG: hypothetical protein C0417_09720 [Chlorobiaceae bacterium]|nr:hypothetical protein [Chlorobiaceae bacterium]
MKDNKPQLYNLAIAWNWEFDSDFISGIEHECSLRGISTYKIDTNHLPHLLGDIKDNKITFEAFFDRASDADPHFLPLVKWMEEHATCLINPYHRVTHAIDKANMHLEFITNGLYVPNTIILSPYNEQRCISMDEKELKNIGNFFVIKPANTTGGGTGVIMNAVSISEIIKARQEHKNDKYLIQETIIPTIFEGKRAWFRVYFAFGEIIPCWWDDQTHRYTELTKNEESCFNLSGLRNTMSIIQRICGLDFFSSEIALTKDGKLVVVDYVNEVCDMRLQSKYYNGAPDDIVHKIEQLIAEHVKTHLNQKNENKL